MECPVASFVEGNRMFESITGLAKRLLERLLNRYGFQVRRIQPDIINQVGSFSALGEQSLIHGYLDQLKPQSQFCVDIGASDGVTSSNTFALFREGWQGLAVEYESERFAHLARMYAALPGVSLAKCKATPVNICALLEGNQVPERFGVLSLDIDGYDYFVLEQILSKFRPSLVCAEINEKIPPPIKFTVRWNPEYAWAADHFYGQSISQLYILCTQYRYALVEMHNTNVFLIPEEISSYPLLAPEEAYSKGYLEIDRKERFPWNADMEELLSLPPEEAVDFINTYFRQYKGKFTCSL
jgi:hypothetical protein